MTTKFDKMLQSIISENNFNFEPTNIQKDDLPTRQNRRRIEDEKDNIEELIRGTINYYRTFENIKPQEQGRVDELEKFSNYITRYLNPYRNFK
jgi:hypothetical protein